jgi:hypothetical protein
MEVIPDNMNVMSIEDIEDHLRAQVENAYRSGYVDGFNNARDEGIRYMHTMLINTTDVKVQAQLAYDPQLIGSVPDKFESLM